MRLRPRATLLPDLLAVALFFAAIVGGSRWLGDTSGWPSAPSARALGLAMLLDTGPLGEELGWRGVALPTLLRRHTPLVSGLLVGFAWTLWHLPTFFLAALPQHAISLPIFTANTVALSLLITWLSCRSRGKLLPAIWVHLLANLAVGAFGAPLAVSAAVLVGLAVVLAATGRLGPHSNTVGGA